MNVILSDRPVQLILSSSRVRSGAAVIEHSSTNDTYRYLQLHASRPGVATELREVLNSHGARPMAGNDDVLYAVAAQLAQKKLFLLQLDSDSASGGVGAELSLPSPVVSKRAPVSAAASTPPPSAKPAAKTVHPVESEPTNMLMQDVQAQSLEAAAVSGTPFCAICEQKKASAQRAPA